MKNISILILLFLLGCGTLMAQPIRKSSYEQTLKAARESYKTRNYVYALERYEEAYEDKEDRSLIDTIAWLNFQIRDYRRAERWFARILRRAEEGELNEYRYIYGQLLKMNESYDEAIEEFQKFLAQSTNDSLNNLAKNEMAGAELAKELPQTMKGVTVENAGRDLNSKISEYSPTLASNGQELYFATFDANDVIYVDEKNKESSYALIYKAMKDDNGWEKPKELGGEINRPEYHNSNVSLSKDGRTMYFTRAQLEGNVLSESKVYYSTGGSEGWSGAQEVQGINGDYLAKHPAVGELFGKEVLFFVSDMPGGYGGFDIYYATKTGEGAFADPVNLGDVINTAGDDETPYYRDGTLYFSSTGHPGLGGFDIFYSTWDGTRWSDPINMGRGYNTSVDDQSLTLDDEGYFGMLVSNRPDGRSAYGRTCCNDLYTVTIAKLYADLVTGLFTIDKKPLPGGTVYLIPTQDDKPGTPDSKTSEDGNRFDFDLGLDMPYMVIATHPDYFPDTMQFNTVGLTESKTFQHFFYLKPKPKLPEYDTITIEEPIVLENILYDFDDDRIREEAESDLEVVYELMTEYPDMKIELSSHTDNRGNDQYNEDLSQRRAESARRWLVRKGISRDRIVAKGYGESQPQTVSARAAALNGFLKEGDVLTPGFIDSLSTEEQKEVAHELNRRTEFKIIEGPTTITIKSTRLRKKESTKPGPDRESLIGGWKADTTKISMLSSLYGKDDLKGLPIMQFKQRVLELGTVKKGEKRRFSYEFVNAGDAPLTISLLSACDCTTIENDPTGDTFHPGEKGVIEVLFDSSEKEEAEEIDIDIFLEESDNEGIPIRETVQYRFDITNS
ncbi:MAG: OmpA family protein [Lewinellaceae bacterium]|nr:OmpA family protein [Lewinellaceae bacterium]